MAHYAITTARGWAANSINARVRLAADNDRLKQETQLLREELRIKDTRMAKIEPHRRPYYTPTERMAMESVTDVGKGITHHATIRDIHLAVS